MSTKTAYILCWKGNLIFNHMTITLDFNGFYMAKWLISPLDWKSASKQTWKAEWGKGAKGKEWTGCLCERCDCLSVFHSPNSMHLDSDLWFWADMMSSGALSVLFFVSYRWIHRSEVSLQHSLNPMGYMQLYLSLKELLRLLKGSYTHSAWHARQGWGDRNSNRRKVCWIHR